MSYLENNFLLENKVAEILYEKYARKMPIFDYHCHLSEYQICANKEFKDIYEIWLGGDHYKWRLMRSIGIDEEYITGKKSNKEKFVTYCKALSTAFANPLYHWSQVELKDFFHCSLEINEKNADKIWKHCNDYIKKHHITPQKLIEGSNVKVIFTTNEIFDDVTIFNKIKKQGFKFKVFPAFRADKIMNIEADPYLEYLAKLGTVKDIKTLEKLIEGRLKAFIKVGCVASDTALVNVLEVTSQKDADIVLKKRIKKQKLTQEDINVFKGYLTYFLLKLYAKYNIRSELHVGAMRNNNSKMLKKLGLDTGYDSIAEENSIHNLSRLMDKLNNENSLPPMVVFNLNPKMNLEILTLINCFQDSSLKGKIQYGPAWWFLDNKEGMYKHLKDLTSVSHIGAFIGMLTDSRSFLSYPRHHYFRCILCSFLGLLVEKHEITNDLSVVGKVIEDICYNNAINYFGIEL